MHNFNISIFELLFSSAIVFKRFENLSKHTSSVIRVHDNVKNPNKFETPELPNHLKDACHPRVIGRSVESSLHSKRYPGIFPWKPKLNGILNNSPNCQSVAS